MTVVEKPPRWAAKVAAFFVILTMMFVGGGLLMFWIMQGVPA
jgi:cell division septal protein FtsQ